MTVSIKTMPDQIQRRYNAKLLPTPERDCPHALFSTPMELPDNQGYIDVQSRYDRLDTFETPLDDGMNNPPSQLLRRVDVPCRIRTYATYIVITRDVVITNHDPVLNSSAARLAQASKETVDKLCRDEWESTAAVINCVYGQNGDIPTEMTLEDVDDIVSTIDDNCGEFITKIIEATLKFGTSPVGDSFGCVLTTKMEPVLNSIKDFVRKFQYPNIEDTLDCEWGGVNNTRFFKTQQGSISYGASMLGNDVANCFFMAKESSKVVWRSSGKARFAYLPPGYGNDPAMLRSTCSSTIWQGQCITNDLWCLKVRSTGI